MIPEDRQDQAIAYLLGELSPGEESAFTRELQRNPELRAFVGEMRETLSALAQAGPQVAPPADLKDPILAIGREGAHPVPVPNLNLPLASRPRPPVAWIAISVALFLLTLTLAFDALTMRARYAGQSDQIASLKHDLDQFRGTVESQHQQIARLEAQNSLWQARVVTLDPQIPPLSKATAVVVWNASQQQGLIRGNHLSGAGAGKDYQLWLIDPAVRAPISAGVITVRDDGTFASTFQPVHPVNTVAKFAISIEVTGGAATPHGPIVFVGG